MYVQKAAGQKTVEGSFVIRSNDSIQAEGQTLVVMYRRKVSHFSIRFSDQNTDVRDQYYIGSRSGGT